MRELQSAAKLDGCGKTEIAAAKMARRAGAEITVWRQPRRLR